MPYRSDVADTFERSSTAKNSSPVPRLLLIVWYAFAEVGVEPVQRPANQMSSLGCTRIRTSESAAVPPKYELKTNAAPVEASTVTNASVPPARTPW